MTTTQDVIDSVLEVYNVTSLSQYEIGGIIMVSTDIGNMNIVPNEHSIVCSIGEYTPDPENPYQIINYANGSWESDNGEIQSARFRSVTNCIRECQDKFVLMFSQNKEYPK